MAEALKIDVNPTDDTVTIEGICYSAQIFRDFGRTMPLDEWFQIKSRDNGVLVIYRGEPDNAGG